MDTKIIKFDTMGDKRGALIAIEQNIQIPFDIKRVYYIFNTKKNVIRGKHAHQNLAQVLVCLNGSCRILVNDGFTKDEYLLDQPDKGLYLGNNIWREMYNFSDNCILMVLASELYNSDDYIRDYEQFLHIVAQNNDIYIKH